MERGIDDHIFLKIDIFFKLSTIIVDIRIRNGIIGQSVV